MKAHRVRGRYSTNSPIFPKVAQLTPLGPLKATRAYPIVAPTMLCVPDTGRLKKVATINHTLVPVSALNAPAIAIFSDPLNALMSMMPFRTVSKRVDDSVIKPTSF